jgi:DNA-binding NtrC family response regulator
MATDTILIVDDESDLLHGLQRSLGAELDARILAADSGPAALELMAAEPVDVVLTDIRMPAMDGLALLDQIRVRDPAITVIVMTAYGTIEKAVGAIKAGAYDFIQKPLDERRLVHLLQKGSERNRLVREVNRLRETVQRQKSFADLVGQSRIMQQVFAKIRMLAGCDITVLIQGETGTGKDLAARAIHRLSPRTNKSFVTVNCPALPKTILESELFGYRKGAFTGADRNREGLFDKADQGTIFLDEIGDLSPEVQTKLLRVLQDKTVRPLGASSGHQVDVRILAATNQNLEARIHNNQFRQDLYFRLNVATVVMPPLRSICEDIPLLVDHFLEKAARQHQRPKKRVTTAVMNRLLAHPWPGNTRQLENLVHNWYALTPETVIEERHITANNPCPQVTSATDIDLALSYQQLKERAVERFTRAYMEKLLTLSRGNISMAAQHSGMKRQSLQKIIRRYGIEPERFRS